MKFDELIIPETFKEGGTMKFKTTTLMMIVFGLILAISLSVKASEKQNPIAGDWRLYFEWDDNNAARSSDGSIMKAPKKGAIDMEIHIRGRMLGRFLTNDGNAGIVIYLQKSGKIFLISRTGYKPIYKGIANSSYMEGEMRTRVGNLHGFWYAERL
jgi:hypothetical protein